VLIKISFIVEALSIFATACRLRKVI